jgi:hypothetical protein
LFFFCAPFFFCKSKSDKIGQNRTKSDSLKIGQKRTDRNRTKSDKIGQNRTKSDKIGQNAYAILMLTSLSLYTPLSTKDWVYAAPPQF